MKSVKLEYFSGIILNPKETIDKILKEKCGWKDILLVLIILALINAGFRILYALIGPAGLELGIFTAILSVVFGVPLLLIHLGVFYIFTYLVGCRGKFKEFASVVSFILIIPIVGLGILGILMNTLLSEEMVALASGTMTLISLYTTNPLAIILYLTRFLIYAYLVYVIHLAIINIYRINKKKALIAASIVFAIMILFSLLQIIFLNTFTDPTKLRSFMGEDNYYYTIAVTEKNVSMCDKIRSQFYKDSCYALVAKTREDHLICEKISENGSKEMCYIMIAEAKKDYSICDKIRNKDRKLRCYRRVKRVVGEN